jgi:hypothetical protein
VTINPIYDELIWSRLSSFWSTDFNPEDREIMTEAFHAYARALDSDYVRLYEIDEAKSLTTCPVWTQRRWLRLDLNRYEELRAWLKFLSGSRSQGAEGGAAVSDFGDCLELPNLHTDHWHIHFPFKMTNELPDPARRTIELSYQMVPSLLEIYRIDPVVTGELRGQRLLPGQDFTVEGTTLVLADAPSGTQYEIAAAFDFTDEAYAGLRPVMWEVDQILNGNVVRVSDARWTNLPVHGLVVREAPEQAEYATNTPGFTTEREFLPFGSADGVRWGAGQQLVLPEGFQLGARDRLFLFGLEIGSSDTIHIHERHTQILNAGNANPDGTTQIQLTVAVAEGLFENIGGFSQEFQLFLDGYLISPDDYRYELATNTVTLRAPYSFSGEGRVDVQFTNERRGDQNALSSLHVHYACQLAYAVTTQEYERFDDGGIYDDDTDPRPNFDLRRATNVVYVGAEVDLETIELYVDGILARNGEDVKATIEEGRTRLAFTFPIEGKSLLVTFERRTALYQYGGAELAGRLWLHRRVVGHCHY